MSTRGYRITVAPLSDADGGGFLAYVPDLPGCMADGSTPDEAYARAEQAIDEWIEEAVRLGRVVPQPSRREAHPLPPAPTLSGSLGS